MTRLDYQAMKQKSAEQPKKPVTWQVRIGSVVYYENDLYSLCHHYKTIHSLTNTVIKAKRN